jgi:hypothetical protein
MVRITCLARDAIARGGRILSGGAISNGRGYHLFEKIANNLALNQDGSSPPGVPFHPCGDHTRKKSLVSRIKTRNTYCFV